MTTITSGQWADALRSGEYLQGQDRLRSNIDGFCCLGVLCDLIDHEGWNQDTEGMYRWADEHYMPPLEILFQIRDMTIGQNGGTVQDMNDQGNPFPAIADAIEERLGRDFEIKWDEADHGVVL